MVEIPHTPAAELVYRVQSGYNSLYLPSPATEPKRAQSYSIITDERLERLAEDLSGLEELHLAGCRRVTHEGLIKVLHHNKNGIRKLSIENVSPLLVRYHCSLLNGT